MQNKLIEYFVGGSNHYPFINQWHNITEFIETHITTNSDWVYFLQILIFSLSILFVMGIIAYTILLAFDVIMTITKILINETKKRI
tara:strand:- start:978 stop:1235 length:258 start_codon:yes stop_codon:yes gene_type:complete